MLHVVAGDDGVSARLFVLTNQFAALLHKKLLLPLHLLTWRLAGHLQLTDGNRHVPAAPNDYLVARQRWLPVDGQLYPKFL